MRPALLLFLALAPALGACAQTEATGAEPGSGRESSRGEERVARITLEYMTAGDLAAVLEHSFRRGLWVRVENRSNSVLISGKESVVAEALDIAAELDVAPPPPANGFANPAAG